MEVIVFALAALGAIAGGVGVIASGPPVRSALALLLVLGCLAIMYLLLSAQFIAVLQVIVYAGAIVVLFLFVIMLLGARTETMPGKLRWQKPVAALLAAAFVAGLGAALRGPAGAGVAPTHAGFGTAESVGRVLYTTFVLPFEVASVILLVGIIAGVVIGRPAAAPRPLPESRAAQRAEAARR